MRRNYSNEKKNENENMVWISEAIERNEEVPTAEEIMEFKVLDPRFWHGFQFTVSIQDRKYFFSTEMK